MAATVVVRCAPLRGEAFDDPRLLALLDTHERERASRKRSPLFVVAHALLRTTVGEVLEVHPGRLVFVKRCDICGGADHGKPAVADHAGLHVSLSYAGSMAVAAVTRAGPIGVDVEEVAATGFVGFPDVTLAPEERAAVESRTGTDLLIARARTWARKEAVLKATGHGLSIDPPAIRVAGPDEPAALVSWADGVPSPGPVQLLDHQVDEGRHVACLAVLTDETLEVG
ncbi:MAG: 4'-phosphopantetheinyl transferase superfamily protein [Micrococcales bacterium]|nr:4'-phosphopantetheinyl transferase superfamily protein [Micrococcales bacterium]